MTPAKKHAAEAGAEVNTIEASIQTILKDLVDIKSKLTKVNSFEEKLDNLQPAVSALQQMPNDDDDGNDADTKSFS